MDAPVRKVTLLEDRAQVVRRGALSLPAGSHVVRVGPVAPVIVDRSVTVRGAGLRLDEARVVRRWRIGAAEQPAEVAALATEHEKLAARVKHDREQLELLEMQRSHYEEATQLLVVAIGRELPFAKEFAPAWPKDLSAFFAAMRRLDTSVLDGSIRLRELYGQLAALDLRLRTNQRVDHLLETELELHLTTQGGDQEVTIEYMVPCAAWRPIHRATLVGEYVHFACEGAVWQATGEDWIDVEMSFSTARPTERAEPPRLQDDLLSVRRKEEKGIEAAIREEVIATTGEPQATATLELPGVDDGGETRLLGASVKATVPADGRMQRVPIFTFESPAEIDRISRPEKAPYVHLRTRQENAAKQTILAGPVELLRDSGYVGRGTVELVAPGERFALSWGALHELRVNRSMSETRDTGKLLGKQTITRRVDLYVSNLEAAARTFRLEERVPVSEIHGVSVEVDRKETKPLAAPDEQGILGWNIDLPAHGTDKIELVYRITAAAAVRGL